MLSVLAGLCLVLTVCLFFNAVASVVCREAWQDAVAHRQAVIHRTPWLGRFWRFFHESAVYPVNLANVVKAAAIISACELARGSNDPLYWFFVVTACIETSVSIGILARLWLTAIRTLPPSTARSEYAVLGAWLGAFSAWQFVFLGLLCMVSTGPAGAPLA